MSEVVPAIAIVDDDKAVQIALTRLLRSSGMEGETFLSAVEFLQSLADRRPDCVLLDIHMPLQDGFFVLAKLREYGIRLPVVVITGMDADDICERAMAGGALAYLRKPLDDQVLLDAITGAIGQSSEPA